MVSVYRSFTMRVAALQYDISNDPKQNLAFVLQQLELAADEGVELVLMPEMWASSFPSTKEGLAERVAADRRCVESLRDKSARLGICVGGSALFADGPQVLNRLEFFQAGESIFVYDKVHLFTPTAEHEIFSPGTQAPPVVAVKGVPVEGATSQDLHLSGGVCYDLRFPELFRVPFRGGVELLCVPAQWPAPRANHWVALSIARAVENQCFVLAANRTGVAFIGRRQARLEFPGNSLIVSPYGDILAQGSGQDGLVSADLDLDLARQFRIRVPVLKDERPDLYREWLEQPSPNGRTDD